MSMVNNDECEKAGIDQKVVAALARRIESVCRDADKLGITVFMGSCSSLRFDDGMGNPLILSRLNVSNCDGGDGGSDRHIAGYERGD